MLWRCLTPLWPRPERAAQMTTVFAPKLPWKRLRPTSVISHLRARCVRRPRLIHNDCHAETSPRRPSLHRLPAVRRLRKSASLRYRHRWCRDIQFGRRHGPLDRRRLRERERGCLRNIHGWRLVQRRLRRSWRSVPERRLGWSTSVRRHSLRITAGILQESHPRC
jgi:hypothetical protein